MRFWKEVLTCFPSLQNISVCKSRETTNVLIKRKKVLQYVNNSLHFTERFSGLPIRLFQFLKGAIKVTETFSEMIFLM